MDEKKITLEKNELQKSFIRVHSDIINTLSSGIYSSPASCIKELINNSFDADAKLVTIRIKPIHDVITIIDDGAGMNAIDFEKNFAWISKSNKRNISDFSESERPLIGKIGIGFIAVNEICDELEITSSKKGENIKFTAKINFKEYREKDTKKNDGIIKGKYTLINKDEDKKEHYTIINLIGLKQTVKNILNDKQVYSKIVKEKNKEFSKCDFNSMKDLISYQHAKNLKTISKDNAYIQFIIDLASYLPVEYIKGGPIEGYENKIIDQIVHSHKKFNFKVDLDGIYLKKPIFFPKRSKNKFVVKTFKENIIVDEEKKISLKGYFYSQNELLTPREFNGVAIRIKNIPIAKRYGFDTSFLSYPTYTDQIFRNWVSGEIYITEGLEEAMSVDRKSFRETHPEYLKLQDFVHNLLRNELFSKLVQNMYDKGHEKREKKKDNVDNLIQKQLLNTNKIIIKSATAQKHPINKHKELKNKEIVSIEKPVEIIKKDRETSIIKINQSIKKKYKKNEWNIIENVFLIFEMASKESKGDIKKLKSLFYHKLDEWVELKRIKK